MNAFINRHKLLFAFIYVAMPVLLAWIGYIVSDYEVTRKLNADETATSLSATTALYDLPRVALSMASNIGGMSGTMKLDIGIEVRKNDLKRVQDYEPRIIERVLLYMRKQNYEKLQEADSARWLRQGLEDEIDAGAVPIKVAGVVVHRMVFE